MMVQEYMTTEVYTVSPQTSAQELARIFSSHKFGAVPVVDDEGHVLGIVSESDLVGQEIKIEFPTYFQFVDGYVFAPGKLREFEEKIEHASKRSAEGLMTKPALVVHPETGLREAATLMVERKIDQLPVVNADKVLVGIISKGDIVRWMAAEHES